MADYGKECSDQKNMNKTSVGMQTRDKMWTTTIMNVMFAVAYARWSKFCNSHTITNRAHLLLDRVYKRPTSYKVSKLNEKSIAS